MNESQLARLELVKSATTIDMALSSYSEFTMQALLKDINALRTELLCKPWLLLLVPGTILLLVYVYRIFFHPLRHIPGPFPAKFTELWRTSKYAKGNWHQDILDLHRQYGPVVRVSPNEISIVDKIGLTEVFGHGKGTRKVQRRLCHPSRPKHFESTEDSRANSTLF